MISIPTDDVTFKVDIYEQIEMQPISIIFGDRKKNNYNVGIIDVGTFTINHE